MAGVLDRFRLDGKVAVVTGAGRGLGQAMALALAEAGATVIAAARTESQLEETASRIAAAGGACLIVRTDVTDSASVRNLHETTQREFGRADILVNNAGGGTPGMDKQLPDITDEDWREGIDLNLTGAFYCARAFAPAMAEQGGGRIINVASGYGLRGGPHNFMYACAKGGVVQLTRSLALTYATRDVRCTCVVPGVFPLTEEAVARWRGGKFIPLGRAGEARELGPLCVFLASPAANYLNGEAVALDGGGLAAGIAPTGFAPRLVRLEADL